MQEISYQPIIDELERLLLQSTDDKRTSVLVINDRIELQIRYETLRIDFLPDIVEVYPQLTMARTFRIRYDDPAFFDKVVDLVGGWENGRAPFYNRIPSQ